MAKVWCCRRLQDAQVFKIYPTRKNVLEEFVLYMKCCSSCNSSVLEILRVDTFKNILKPLRINSKKIEKFIKNMKILWKPKQNFQKGKKISRFILNYNEFGKIKKCTKNLSNLKIGKIETNPISNLYVFKEACRY